MYGQEFKDVRKKETEGDERREEGKNEAMREKLREKHE